MVYARGAKLKGKKTKHWQTYFQNNNVWLNFHLILYRSETNEIYQKVDWGNIQFMSETMHLCCNGIKLHRPSEQELPAVRTDEQQNQVAMEVAAFLLWRWWNCWINLLSGMGFNHGIEGIIHLIK